MQKELDVEDIRRRENLRNSDYNLCRGTEEAFQRKD